MIYDELCACGVDNWYAMMECKFSEVDEIETELNKFDKFEECDD